jgi:hypothetical protein
MFQVDKMKYFAVEMIQEYGIVINLKIFLRPKQAYLNFASPIMAKLFLQELEIIISLDLL